MKRSIREAFNAKETDGLREAGRGEGTTEAIGMAHLREIDRTEA
jgi:hypothetical protein